MLLGLDTVGQLGRVCRGVLVDDVMSEAVCGEYIRWAVVLTRLKQDSGNGRAADVDMENVESKSRSVTPNGTCMLRVKRKQL